VSDPPPSIGASCWLIVYDPSGQQTRIDLSPGQGTVSIQASLTGQYRVELWTLAVMPGATPQLAASTSFVVGQPSTTSGPCPMVIVYVKVWTGKSVYSVGDEIIVYWSPTASDTGVLTLTGPSSSDSPQIVINLDPNAMSQGQYDVGHADPTDVGSWTVTLVINGPPGCPPLGSGSTTFQVGQGPTTTLVKFRAVLQTVLSADVGPYNIIAQVDDYIEDPTGTLKQGTIVMLDSLCYPNVPPGATCSGTVNIDWPLQVGDTVEAYGELGVGGTPMPPATVRVQIGYTPEYLTKISSGVVVNLLSETTDGKQNVGTITFDGTQHSLPAQVTVTPNQNYGVTANPPSGYVFDHWEIGNGVTGIGNQNAQSTTVYVQSGGYVKAWFKPVSPSNTPPQVSVSTPTVDCPSRTVTITGQATPTTPGATITRIHVDWGDNNAEDVPVANPFSASHTYANDGTYTITVTTYDSNGLSTIAKVNTIATCPNITSWRITPPYSESGTDSYCSPPKDFNQAKCETNESVNPSKGSGDAFSSLKIGFVWARTDTAWASFYLKGQWAAPRSGHYHIRFFITYDIKGDADCVSEIDDPPIGGKICVFWLTASALVRFGDTQSEQTLCNRASWQFACPLSSNGQAEVDLDVTLDASQTYSWQVTITGQTKLGIAAAPLPASDVSTASIDVSATISQIVIEFAG
jgi:PKD domain/Divergent InlB B-repeat domain